MRTGTAGDDFESRLFERVNAHFTRHHISKKADIGAWVKLWSISLIWISTLSLIFTVQASFAGYILLYLFHGLASLLVIFNISHDAVHQTLSKKKWVNDFWGYTFNLVGGNRYSWYLKHNLSHHQATNIHQQDLDIETTPLFRISPHSKWRWHYRFQHLYMLPLYMLMSLLLIFILDIRAVSMLKQVKPVRKSYRIWAELVFSKISYLGYIIILPACTLPITAFQVIICFLVMHAFIGLIIALVLFPSHFIDPVSYYEQNETRTLPSSWAVHQLKTTVDIAPNNKVVLMLLGGLNANVLHHIFPAIHHCHFLPLIEILQTTAAEYNIPYHSYSLYNGVQQHLLYLKKMGAPEN